MSQAAIFCPNQRENQDPGEGTRSEPDSFGPNPTGPGGLGCPHSLVCGTWLQFYYVLT